MIRLIIRTDDANTAAHVGGAALTTWRTIDVHLPEVEALLRSGGFGENGYAYTQLVGAEVIESSATPTPEPTP